MKNKFNKGIITIQTGIMIATSIVTVTGAFYGSKIATNTAINDSEKSLTFDINLNGKQIIENKTNIENIEGKLDDINENLKILIEKI